MLAALLKSKLLDFGQDMAGRLPAWVGFFPPPPPPALTRTCYCLYLLAFSPYTFPVCILHAMPLLPSVTWDRWAGAAPNFRTYPATTFSSFCLFPRRARYRGRKTFCALTPTCMRTFRFHARLRMALPYTRALTFPSLLLLSARGAHAGIGALTFLCVWAGSGRAPPYHYVYHFPAFAAYAYPGRRATAYLLRLPSRSAAPCAPCRFLLLRFARFTNKAQEVTVARRVIEEDARIMWRWRERHRADGLAATAATLRFPKIKTSFYLACPGLLQYPSPPRRFRHALRTHTHCTMVSMVGFTHLLTVHVLLLQLLCCVKLPMPGTMYAYQLSSACAATTHLASHILYACLPFLCSLFTSLHWTLEERTGKRERRTEQSREGQTGQTVGVLDKTDRNLTDRT